MLRHFEGNHVKALQKVFPSLHFDEIKFIGLRGTFAFFLFIHYLIFSILIVVSDKYSNSKSNRKKTIIQFAKKKGLTNDAPFDWYQIEAREIRAFEVLL